MRLTPKDAAAALDVSRSLVYSLLRQKKRAAIRVGVRRGKWLIQKEELDRYLESC